MISVIWVTNDVGQFLLLREKYGKPLAATEGGRRPTEVAASDAGRGPCTSGAIALAVHLVVVP